MNRIMKKSMSNSLLKQNGMTMLGMMIVVGFILFQLVLVMNIFPAYMTDSTIKNIIEKLPEDPSVKNKTAKEVKAIILKRMRINSVYGLEDIVKVKKARGEIIVTVDYEPRGTLVGNLEYIIKFEHEVRITSR